MMSNKNWHAIGAEGVFKELSSNKHGLTEKEAAFRLEKFGLNEIPENGGIRIFRLFIGQFQNPLIIILLAASGISFLLKDLLDSAIILGAVIINTTIGFSQEWRASNILGELKRLSSFKNIIRRDGRIRQVDASEIVPGDVVILRRGDKVPADGRIISLSSFATGEMILTGESVPVEKFLGAVEENAPVADRTNMVFMGTLVEEGSAEMIVVATGEKTEFGLIASLIKEEKEGGATPLQVRLRSFAKKLGLLFLALAAALFIIGIASGREVLTMFLTAVAVSVAAVPESLPIVVSVTLAIGAKHILKAGGLVKKMIATEALGSTTVIAADKTATLTEGRMRLVGLVTADGKKINEPDFLEIVSGGKRNPELLSLELLALISSAYLNNPEEPPEKWLAHGSPIDKAILLTLARAGLSRESVEKNMPMLGELPFNAKYKYSASLNRSDDDKNIISVLGAPEVVLSDSATVVSADGSLVKLNDDYIRKINQQTIKMAEDGLRVLALGYKEAPQSVAIDRKQVSQLTFLAIVIFSDPIREEVKESVEIARSAGIRSVIITGDHILTANYVARQLGILKGEKRFIEGKDLPEDLAKYVNDYDVFARVSPEQKVKIVKAFRENKENVAVIGDGVNDAPSLLEADIGVAVGSGTDVAKEASDLVLLNDSFSIIVEAIRQGRVILDNVRKAVVFLLSGAFSELILISGSIILGLPLALLPAQILWVNIVEDGLPGVALAFEKGEKGIMKRAPQKESIFTKEMKKMLVFFAVITDITLFFIFYLLLRQNGGNLDYARTIIFVGLGLTSLFYIFSVKSLTRPIWRMNLFDNKFMVFSVVVGIGLYLVAIYLPLFQKILNTVPLGVYDWLFLAGLGIFNVALIELGKFWFIKNGK